MTIVEAYNKYNEIKAWYDSKTGAFMYRISVIDAKIDALKQKALTAVGAALTKIMNTIEKWIKRITNVINTLQDFIATVEQKVKQWITDKIDEITNKIKEKIKQAAQDKVEAAAAATISAPIIPEMEQPLPIPKLDYSGQYPGMPEVPQDPPQETLSVTDLPGLVDKYSAAEDDGGDNVIYVKRLVLGKCFTLGQVWIGGKLQCYTCEDRDRGLVWDGKLVKPNREAKVPKQTAIPVGKYEITFRPSSMGPTDADTGVINIGGTWHKPTVRDIGTSGDSLANKLFGKVRWHSGNHANNTDGCLLLGKMVYGDVSKYEKDAKGSGNLRTNIVGDSKQICKVVIGLVYDKWKKLNAQKKPLYVVYTYADNCKDYRNS